MNASRTVFLAGLSVFAASCATVDAEAPAARAPTSVSAPRNAWKTLDSPLIGFSISVPASATATEETRERGAGSNGEVSRVSVRLDEARSLVVVRSDLASMAAARVLESFIDDVRDDLVSIRRDEQTEVSGYPGLAVEGESEDKSHTLRTVAVGRSVYTALVLGPISDETRAIAERVVASFRIVPTPRLRFSAAWTYAVQVPDIAFDIPSPVPELEGSSARVFGLDPASPDAMVVIETPLAEGALNEGVDALFERSLRGIASSGAQIEGLKTIEVVGLPGREILKRSDGMWSRVRMIVTNDKLFVVGVTARAKATLDRPDYHQFLTTFRPLP